MEQEAPLQSSNPIGVRTKKENEVVADDIYQFLTRPDIQNEYLSSHHQTGKIKFYYVYEYCYHSRSADHYI